MKVNDPNEGIDLLRATVVALVRREDRALTARQLGVFLTCYLQDDTYNAGDLAAELGLPKPVITQALDRLSELDLARLGRDPVDRRRMCVQRTATGVAFLREIQQILDDVAVPPQIPLEPSFPWIIPATASVQLGSWN